MVQFIRDDLGALLEGHKIKHIIIAIEFPFDFDSSAIIVAVQAFAFVAFVAYEMARAKYEVILGDADFEFFRHGQTRQPREIGAVLQWYRPAARQTRMP